MLTLQGRARNAAQGPCSAGAQPPRRPPRLGRPADPVPAPPASPTRSGVSGTGFSTGIPRPPSQQRRPFSPSLGPRPAPVRQAPPPRCAHASAPTNSGTSAPPPYGASKPAVSCFILPPTCRDEDPNARASRAASPLQQEPGFSGGRWRA